MFKSTPDERLIREVTQEQYDKIKDTWLRHVSLEMEGKFEQALKETITEDCLYEHVQSGSIWEGHSGALAFYKELTEAVPDMAFDLQDVVIGPQGVLGIADMTGTQKKPFAGIDQCGQKIHWRLINMFTWDPKEEKFSGERIYNLTP
jgi:predicted ester cyclase